MLRLVRTHAQSWLIKAILWLVVGAFVGTIFYSWGMGGATKDNVIVGTVNGSVITVKEYRKDYLRMMDYYRKKMKKELGEDIIKGVKEVSIKNIINRKLLIQKAAEEGLMVTDEELRANIRSLPYFKVDGRFKEDIYLSFLNNNGILPKDFEEITRNDILAAKVENMVKGAIRVSDAEIMDLISMMEETTELDYLLFTGKNFKNKVAATDEELAAYYKKNRERFRRPEKRSAEYIFAPAEEFIDKARVADDEMEDYYYDFINEFQTPEEVRVRHILITFKKEPGIPMTKEVDDAARGKAESILKELKGGADFARLAREYSFDTASAAKGGDLGFFTRGMMLKPFEDAAFALKKGETSGLVRTRLGYHIIRVEDRREETTKPLEEAKPLIKEKIKKKKGMRRAKKHLAELIQETETQSDALETLAKKLNAEISLTEPLSRMDTETGELQNARQTISELFSLTEGEISAPVPVEGGYYLLRIKQMLPSSIPPLEEVKEEARLAYIDEAAENLCAEEVGNFVAELTAGKTDLKDLGKKFGLEVSSSGPLNHRQVGAKFQLDREKIEDLFRKKIDGAGYVKTPGGHYLYMVRSREEPGKEKFDQKKGAYQQAILEGKRDSIFKAWLQELRAGARIEINRSLID